MEPAVIGLFVSVTCSDVVKIPLEPTIAVL